MGLTQKELVKKAQHHIDELQNIFAELNIVSVETFEILTEDLDNLSEAIKSGSDIDDILGL